MAWRPGLLFRTIHNAMRRHSTTYSSFIEGFYGSFDKMREMELQQQAQEARANEPGGRKWYERMGAMTGTMPHSDVKKVSSAKVQQQLQTPRQVLPYVGP